MSLFIYNSTCWHEPCIQSTAVYVHRWLSSMHLSHKTHMCAHTCIHTHMHAHRHAHTHSCMCVCMQAHTHTHTQR